MRSTPRVTTYTLANSYLGLGGYSGSSGAVNIAIDVNGNAWAINSSVVGEFNSSGTISQAGGYTGLGLNSPTFIAMDASSNAWIGNTSGGNVVKVSSSGTLSGTFTGSDISQPGPVAIDTSGNAWVADLSSGAIVKLSPTGTPTNYTAATLSTPTGIAIDHSGNVWVSNSNSVVEISSTGALISPAAGYSNSSTTGLLGVAIDGAGNAWVAGPSSIAEISSSGTILSGSTGFTAVDANSVKSIAVDASGDVWTNYVAAPTVFCTVLLAPPLSGSGRRRDAGGDAAGVGSEEQYAGGTAVRTCLSGTAVTIRVCEGGDSHEEIDDWCSWMCGGGVGGCSAACADGMRRFAGEPDRGAGAGGRRGAVFSALRSRLKARRGRPQQ